MKIISDQELLTIQGGGISWGVIGLIATGVVTFLIGVLDGLKRPFRCYGK